MSEPLALTNFAIIALTSVVSWIAFRHPAWVERLVFEPKAILRQGEYYRMLSSALLHADGNHLFGNMLTLYFFGSSIEQALGPQKLLAVYLISILGGSALSLWLHRNHEYRALGASGGVCGVLFAWILFFPSGTVAFLFIPIPIPGWVFAIGYLVFSFLGMRHGWGNIGHDAHIGGALIGMLTAAALEPRAVAESPWLFAGILAFGSLLFLYLWRNPLMLPWRHFQVGRPSSMPPRAATPRSQPSDAEVDAILEKVARSGIQSLTAKERQTLERAARR